ncbi:hypothetical protein SAMN05216276_107842 [Streptosporangium subroseum]|uniref:Uncharacterized protein n=1 Tax=Streptosporangium subroseum TaxID=106412 RepID=A0A239P0I8_9ACTN|nr:hypothetical protein [Streptosporangium subroseum]SNT60657.1 hypothetical protein SAMN05216276_107842 [Streptosporangium subroseum]
MTAANAFLSMTCYAHQRYGVPYVRTSVRVRGERQIRTFLAMCRLAGRRPHELAADLVLAAIRAAQCDHEVQHAVAELSAALSQEDTELNQAVDDGDQDELAAAHGQAS